MLEKLDFTSTRLLENTNLTSNSLIESGKEKKLSVVIESTLKANADIIEQGWEARHAKYCYKYGVGRYVGLIDKARKYGNNPKALLAHLVSKELSYEAA